LFLKEEEKMTAHKRIPPAIVATLLSIVSLGLNASSGRVALHTWLTVAEFKDITVTGADGTVLWKGLPDVAACNVGSEARWTVVDGALRQTNGEATTGGTLVFGDPAWRDYTLRVKARRLSGKEGFILHVRERTPACCVYANYGGWFNSAHGIETKGAFDFSTPRRAPAHTFRPIVDNRWYDLEVTCRGERVTMSIDGTALMTDVPVPAVSMDAPVTDVVVDAGQARFPVSRDLWGIFFEDIDLALDGGIYAEMVRNRSFEDGLVVYRKQKTIGFWNPVGAATLARGSSKPLSAKNAHYGRVEALAGGGVANDGYFGMGLKKGAAYRLSVALRGRLTGPLEVSLESLGRTFARGAIDGIGSEWKTFTLRLVSSGTDPDAKLVFRAPGGGTFDLDCVSLFPCDTYGKSGLFRKDLMERLAALKPSFVRFPGGCWVEGNTMAEAYRWKTTIGDVWERRTQWNLWGYWSSNGVGFHEYLVLCEELGAKALFCINCGMSHRENVPLDKMDEFVQDALDCIEYANGPVTSKWGAVRAANGHPAPFNLQYLEIGNENGGKAYHARYALIHDAVRAKYPEIKIISNYWFGHVKGRPQHMRDEHYYQSPDWFMSTGAKLYDTYPRGSFTVFVGEYAVTSDVGRWGDLRAAIGEAAFMCGLERNADIVKLAAYAPLFANARHTAWRPNLIYPLSDGNFVNPSWNVQKLFSENRGVEVLAFEQRGRFLKTKNGAFCRAIATSAVRDRDGSVIVKAVNCSNEPQPYRLSVAGAPITRAAKTCFTGPDARASNSPLARERLRETTSDARLRAGAVEETLPPLSLTVYRLRR
jgi:alpha-L-arabinofuranosidase